MNHIEGGWPAEVKVQFIEYRNKFIRKVVKEEMFVFTISKVVCIKYLLILNSC